MMEINLKDNWQTENKVCVCEREKKNTMKFQNLICSIFQIKRTIVIFRSEQLHLNKLKHNNSIPVITVKFLKLNYISKVFH